MKISINYRTEWNQAVYVSGNIPELGLGDEAKAVVMTHISESEWELEFDLHISELQYHYLIKENDRVVRREWGHPHILQVKEGKKYKIRNLWKEIRQQQYFYSSAFTEVFFGHEKEEPASIGSAYQLIVDCPFVTREQVLRICGSSPVFGQWDTSRSLKATYIGDAKWIFALDKSQLQEETLYKLVICDKKTGECLYWEEGENRLLKVPDSSFDIQMEHIAYRHYQQVRWYGTGVSIPVFSLRTKESFGIGDFCDLKKLVDWTAVTGQQVIQLLPVNDTTLTLSWRDSYPYNAISIYALHPIYLGLYQYPLRNAESLAKYRQEAAALNMLDDVNYDRVIRLKYAYCKELFGETGDEVMNSNEYLKFYSHNEEWLFPYACFSYLRDSRKTADFTQWEEYRNYDSTRLQLLMNTDKEAKEYLRLVCFIQFLLHQQLTGAREYAHQNKVILKGDIPIGINRNSVEAWTEPHLFHMDMQTGAPPDEFSVYGQNWGFPTYNWEEMSRDGYSWWKKRFRKMADYFDAYRIDHILGFFRIWEIPLTSVQGLLGHFSPAFPLTTDEIRKWGVKFDSVKMTQPYIHQSFLSRIFGEYTEEVASAYLQETEPGLFRLNNFWDSQDKIRQLFQDKDDTKSKIIRDGLYQLCNDVMFIEDRNEPNKYHPRIIAQTTHIFETLDLESKESFAKLYDDFFYFRHSGFWQHKAMEKLPVLLLATSMLACGEDLGMIPASVPTVMRDLQILSLEIERMPKEFRMFADLSGLPYPSVCTTSTHDMSPIRAWWLENKKKTQAYFNNILKRDGTAPDECTVDICRQILTNHLNSSSMLVILPIQDWLSIDGKLRKPDPDSERINVPSDPLHYWRYRMHLPMEELIEAKEYNQLVKKMVGIRYHKPAE